MVPELINKYVFLMEILTAAGTKGLKLGEICSKYEDRFDTPYNRRSFNNHRAAIEEVFGVEILCNRSTSRYHLRFPDDMFGKDSSTEWLINTFTVNNLLTLGKKQLSGRVAVDDIPSGHKHLTGIIDLMQKNHEMTLEYRKYTSSTPELLHVRPYAVKESDRRWYLVGFCTERNGMRVYGMDRIVSFTDSGKSFRMPKNFDVEDLFQDSIGVYLSEAGSTPVTIVLATDEANAGYLRDLPIHRSQEELPPSGGKFLFRIRALFTRDLLLRLCSYGSTVEVVSPPGVREAIGRELSRAASQYDAPPSVA